MSEKHRDGISLALLLTAASLLAGCSNLGRLTSDMSANGANPVNWITPYRADVIQGNFISSEQVAALRPGMSRTEVRNLLGTPLVASVFHADRWDYVFTLRRRGGEARVFRYAVFFKADTLERSDGDAMPSEAEFIAQINSRRFAGKVPALEASAEQLQQAERQPAAPAQATPADETAAASISYPPLESPRP